MYKCHKWGFKEIVNFFPSPIRYQRVSGLLLCCCGAAASAECSTQVWWTDCTKSNTAWPCRCHAADSLEAVSTACKVGHLCYIPNFLEDLLFQLSESSGMASFPYLWQGERSCSFLYKARWKPFFWSITILSKRCCTALQRKSKCAQWP